MCVGMPLARAAVIDGELAFMEGEGVVLDGAVSLGLREHLAALHGLEVAVPLECEADTIGEGESIRGVVRGDLEGVEFEEFGSWRSASTGQYVVRRAERRGAYSL